MPDNNKPTFGIGDGIVTTDIGFVNGSQGYSGFDEARSVLIQSDGKIVVSGTSAISSGLNEFSIVRYTSTGALDTTFGGGDGKVVTPIGPGSADDQGRAMAIQPDGSIVVAGISDGKFVLVRYTSTGAYDATFAGGASIVTTQVGTVAEVERVVIQPDGSILVVGQDYNGSDRDFVLLRYTSDGVLDTTFGGGDGIVITDTDDVATSTYWGDGATDVVVQPDGAILVVGYGENGLEMGDPGVDSNYQSRFTLVRYTSNGTLDASFGGGDGIVHHDLTDTLDTARRVFVQGDGSILVVGYSEGDDVFGSAFNGQRFVMMRYTSDGVLDSGFGGGDGFVVAEFPVTYYLSGDRDLSFTLQSDGGILVTGSTGNGLGSGYGFATTRYTSAGVLDTSFGGGDGVVTTDIGTYHDWAYDVAVQADGAIVVVGTSENNVDGNSTYVVVRYTSDGDLDTGFDIENGLGGAVFFTEGDEVSYLDRDVVLVDADLDALNGGAGDYVGSALTVSRSGGANAEDTFSFNTAVANFTVSGNNLLFGGQIFATFTSAGGALNLNFTSTGTTATSALVAAVLQTISYENTSESPPASTEVEWVFDDGNAGAQGSGGAMTAMGSVTVNINQINDAPVFNSGDGIVTTKIGSGETYSEAYSAVLQSDNKIVVAGLHFDGNDQSIALLRYTESGELDTSFGGGDGYVTTLIGEAAAGYSVALQQDGAILVAGFSSNATDEDLALARYTANGVLDTTFGGGDGIVTVDIAGGEENGQSIAVQSDGAILVAGTVDDKFALFRFTSAGVADTTFGNGDGLVTTSIGGDYDTGQSVAIQNDGKILVAGYSYNGSDGDMALVRYTSAGVLDTTFGNGDGIVTTDLNSGWDIAESVVILGDGSILVAGSFDEQFAVARYTSAGVLDTSFGTNGIAKTIFYAGDSFGQSIAVQADGGILIAGYTEGATSHDFLIVRYTSAGIIDPTFGPGGPDDLDDDFFSGNDGMVVTPVGFETADFAYKVVVQPDGNIIVVGNSDTALGTDVVVMRYTPDGRLDESFDSPNGLGGIVAYTEGGAAVVLDDDVAVIDPELDALNAGDGDYSGATLTLARNGSASADDVLGFDITGASFTLDGANLQSGGQTFGTFALTSGTLVVSFTSSETTATTARVQEVMESISYENASENPDASARINWTFDDGNSGTQGIGGAQMATGSVTVDITAVNDTPTFGIGDADGIVTTPIGSGHDEGYSVTVQDDGKILVAGRSHNGSNMDFGLVRYNADGSLDTSFDGDGIATTAIGASYSEGFGVAVQADGKVLVAGSGHNGSNADFALVRYNVDGSHDTTFDGDGVVMTDFGSVNDIGRSVTVQTDGKILVSGRSYNGSNYDFSLVRYNSDGSLDATFNSGGTVTTDIGLGNDEGYSVTVQADGKILLAGTSSGDFALVRYNTDGSLDTTFDSDGIVSTDIDSGNDWGQSVTVQADGKILVAGYSSNNDFALIRYNTDGSLDASFDGDGIATTVVGAGIDRGYSVTVQADGKILVAGKSNNNSNNDFALVRYNTDGSLDSSFDSDGIVTTAIGSHSESGQSITVQADGKILVAGYSSNGSNNDFALVRYNSDGSLDTTFDNVNVLDGTVAYTEDAAAIILDDDVAVVDADLDALNGGDGDYAGSTLTLARNGGASADDVLGFDTTGASFTVDGANLKSGGQTFATFALTSGTLVISFTSSEVAATTALVQEVMEAVSYENSSDDPDASVDIDWTFDDGNSGAQGTGGAGSVTGSVTVNITAANDAPVISGIEAAAGTYLEHDQPHLISSSLTLSDGDDTNLEGATVEITSGFDAANDTLAFVNQNGITGSFVGAVLTLSGTATLAQYQAALQSITYANGFTTESTATRTFSFTVNDGDVDSNVGTRSFGMKVNETITGDAQANTLEGDYGNDTIYGLGGNDTLYGNGGNDTLRGGTGNDRLYGDSGADKLYGDSGNDTLYGSHDNDKLYGSNGADKLYGDRGNDKLYGGNDNDKLYGGNDKDRLYGDKGNDRLYGDKGDDRLYGGNNNDKLYGGNNKDRLYGDKGNDTLYGGKHDDLLEGGKGNDKLHGDSGNDKLYGENNNDKLYGDTGKDKLYGDKGNDTLYGGKHNDFLEGGRGTDKLYGGSGKDVFHFNRGDDKDTIKDFKDNSDTLELDNFRFSNVADALSHATQKGNDVVFNFGGGDKLTVEDITIAHLANDLDLV